MAFTRKLGLGARTLRFLACFLLITAFIGSSTAVACQAEEVALAAALADAEIADEAVELAYDALMDAYGSGGSFTAEEVAYAAALADSEIAWEAVDLAYEALMECEMEEEEEEEQQ